MNELLPLLHALVAGALLVLEFAGTFTRPE